MTQANSVPLQMPRSAGTADDWPRLAQRWRQSGAGVIHQPFCREPEWVVLGEDVLASEQCPISKSGRSLVALALTDKAE